MLMSRRLFVRSLVFLFTTFLLFTKQNLVLGAVTISLSPSPIETVPISSTRQFMAPVSGTPTTTVTWSLTAPAGVNPSTIGTIDATGKYTAPPNPLPNFASLTVTATSVADPSVSASTTVIVRYSIPWPTSLTPNPLPFGPFTLTVNGSRFVNGAQVLWNNQPLTTSFISPNQLLATGVAAQAGAINITVANPGPGAVSSVLTLTVSSTLSVTVSPTSISLAPNGTQQFQVTVDGVPIPMYTQTDVQQLAKAFTRMDILQSNQHDGPRRQPQLLPRSHDPGSRSA